MKKIDWAKHNRDYETSGLTIREFCKKRGLKMNTFANYRYTQNRKRKAAKVTHDPLLKFREFDVGTSIEVRIDGDEKISLHGILPEHVTPVLRAICALSQ